MTKAGCSVLLVPGLLQAAAQVVDPHVLEAQQLLQPSHFHLQDLSGVQPSARPALSPVPSPTRDPPTRRQPSGLGPQFLLPHPAQHPQNAARLESGAAGDQGFTQVMWARVREGIERESCSPSWEQDTGHLDTNEATSSLARAQGCHRQGDLGG